MKVKQVPYFGARGKPKKVINDIWDENLIMTKARAKDRELTQYQIKNFDVDKEINKMFKLHSKKRKSSGYEFLI